MRNGGRDLKTLRLIQHAFRSVQDCHCRAAHHRPAHRLIPMPRSRQLSTRVQVQEVDAKAWRDRERLGVTPGLGAARVGFLLLAIYASQLGDNLGDVLRATLVRHEQSVGGLYDHQVLHADGCDQRTSCIHVQPLAVLQHHVALNEVVIAIARSKLPKCLPGADIAPADIQRQHRCLASLLHDGVINRNVR